MKPNGHVHNTFSWPHLISILSGALLITGFFSLGETYNGLSVRFLTPFTNSSDSGESHFWLAHLYYFIPATALLGYGLCPFLKRPLISLKDRIKGLDRRNVIIWLLCLFFAVVVLSKLGNSLVLQGYPITDDEYAAKFGGEILASGKVKVPVPDWYEAYPARFLFVKDGFFTSLDWPGSLAAWALAYLTGLGSIIFSILAALPYIAVALIIGMKFGKHWGAAAAFILICSPMAAAMTITTHNQLATRAFLSLVILFYYLTTRRDRKIYWSAVGLFAGCSFFHRPFETAFLTLPFIIDILYRMIKREISAGSLLAALTGAALPLIAFGIMNNAVTGDPLLPARLAESDINPKDRVEFLAAFKSIEVLWNRFGANTNYNLMMLMVWFLGPVGVILVAFGSAFDRFSRMLSLCVLSHLCLGLFHDNHGLHIVGPIHYSEDAVFLSLIAVHGLYTLARRIKTSCPAAIHPLACTLMFTLFFGMGAMSAWQMKALNRQSHIQSGIYGWIEDQDLRDAVILAPRFYQIWMTNGIPARYAETGSFVFEWRMTKPDYSEEVLILRDVAGEIPNLRKAFPGRSFYRMTIDPRRKSLKLEEIEGSREGS